MLKSYIAFISLLTLSSAALSEETVDLMQVYNAALNSDQVYKAAEATFLANKEIGAQARALLLPNLAVTGHAVNYYGWEKTNAKDANDFSPAGYIQGSQRTLSYNVQITQPLFNWDAIVTWRYAKASVKQATTNFASAKQDLMLRVVTAYFRVLQQQDILRFTLAQRQALASQLDVARQQYKVGAQPITTVYQAQAAYDAVNAQYFANRNEVSNSLEALGVITGKLYTNLAKLRSSIPLLPPNPKNIEQWIQTALKHNLSLQAASFGQMAAQENIRVQSAARWPQLNLVANYEGTAAIGGNKRFYQDEFIGVSLSANLFQGGAISSKTRQAQAQYKLATAQADKTYRDVIMFTRTNYLSVLSGINQVKADREAIKSSRSALESTRAGYKVGTQTINDVLDAQKTLVEAQTNHARDRINYLINTLTLKQSTGSLSVDDLEKINQWLQPPK